MELYDLKTARTRLFLKNIRIDHIKRQRLAEHPSLPTLYEEFEGSPELTSFRKHFYYKIIKTKSENGPERARTRQRFYDIKKPSPVVTMVYHLSPRSKINVKFPKINVKFPKINTKIEEKWNISAKR